MDGLKKMMNNDNDSVNELYNPSHHRRRNAISIPIRTSSLEYTFPSFEFTTTPPTPSNEIQMTRMKQLMCKAIHQLRTLARQVAEAEENAAYWQKKWEELDAKHTQLCSSHHDTLVSLKTTRRILLSTRREKFELGRRR